MAGDTGQGIDMERRLGQPFGVALYGLGVFVTFGALDIDVTPGYGQQGLYGMRLVAIGAVGVLAMCALPIFGHDGGVAVLTFCPRWPNLVSRMMLRDIVVAGNTSDSRMCRQLIFQRIDVEVCPLTHDGLFTVAGKTIVRCRIRCRHHEKGQECRCR